MSYSQPKKYTFFLHFSGKPCLSKSRSDCLKGRCCLTLEAILWLIFISVPINLASIYFALEAPEYIHDPQELKHGYNAPKGPMNLDNGTLDGNFSPKG